MNCGKGIKLVRELFEDKELEKIKIDKQAWVSFLGLWGKLAHPKSTNNISYPLPPVARIVPLVVSRWNTLKGGGDTITKLDDICQERIGIWT